MKKTSRLTISAPQSGFLSVTKACGVWGIPVSVEWLNAWTRHPHPSSAESGDHLLVSRLDLEVKTSLCDEPIVV